MRSLVSPVVCVCLLVLAAPAPAQRDRAPIVGVERSGVNLPGIGTEQDEASFSASGSATAFATVATTDACSPRWPALPPRRRT